MQMIGQVAMKGMQGGNRQHQLLFVDSVAQVASKNAEVWQRFGRRQALFNEITRPAACLDDLLPPMPDNRSAFAEDIPFGFHSGRNIRMHKFGLLSTGKAQVDTGLVGVGDIMPDTLMLNTTYTDYRIRNQLEDPVQVMRSPIIENSPEIGS